MASTTVQDGTSEFTLTPWLHPAMKFSFPLDPKDIPIKVGGNMTVAVLIEKVEQAFEDKSFEAGTPHQMQVQVLWNLNNNNTKACNPSDKVDVYFKDGDTFGIYGDAVSANSMVARKQIPEDKKTPVTILTGFLGAGKTTLLNYILQEQQEKKIAIIENEFGKVSIDDELLKGNKLALAEKVITMDNGCICCTIRGDLIKGLRQMLDEIQNGSHIDAIMIETTGMADPVPIIRTFMANPAVTEELRLDAVVTVVDAKHILARLDDDIEKDKVNEAYQQVAFCDKLLLNKLDLVTTEQAIAVKDRIRSINAFAKVLPCVKGKVKMAELFNIRAHDMCHFTETEIEKEAEALSLEFEHGQGHGQGGHGYDGHGDDDGHGHSHDDDGHGHDACRGDDDGHGHGRHTVKNGRHDTRVNSMSIVREGEILPDLLGQWMQSLAYMPEEKGIIFRIKAILAVKDHPFKHVFHAVMDVSDEDDADAWAEGEKRVSKIVFIGKSLDEDHLRQGFEGIFES